MDNNPIAIGVHKHSSSSRPSRREREESNKKEEDAGARTKRREKEDRDAKRRARSSDNKAASVPGAHASTGAHKSNRKSSKRSTGNEDKLSKSHRSRDSRSPKRDEKAAYRSSRSGSASVPGAQAEASSPRRSKRDEKGKERRGTRATKPGAEASTSSRDSSRSKSKSSGGRSNKEGEINMHPLSTSERSSVPDDGLPKIGEDEEHIVAAITVEEEEKQDEDAIQKERENARAHEMVAVESEKERKRMEAELQTMREKIERIEAERKEKEEKAKKCVMMLCGALTLVLIGAIVASIFAVQGAKSSDTVTQIVTVINNATAAPTSKMATPAPTSSPSVGPTEFVVRYDPPSSEDCLAVSKGEPTSTEGVLLRNFQLPLDVVLSETENQDEIAQELNDSIQALLMPELLGCPSTTTNRKLQTVLNDETNNFVIANAVVNVQAKGGACVRSDKTPCVPVLVTIDLSLKGPERILTLMELINRVFGYNQDLVEKLQLSNTPYVEIVLVTIDSGTITEAPTMVPTAIATKNPTSTPSASPTFAPVIGPTTPAPTRSPTKSPSIAPSRAPSFTPSSAPTPTPPPTVAPQPGITPSPTTSPSVSPTKTPSRTPSAKPSLRPSATPSTKPTEAPSLAPSATPSLASSTSPTIAASVAPTPAPTNSPTVDTTGLVSLLNAGMFVDQSSTLDHPAANALDGKYDTFVQTQSGANQWWRTRVQDYYGQLVTVNKVTVWNRRDCCQERLEGAVVLMFGIGEGNLIATSAPLTSAEVQTVDFGEVIGVAWVQIHQDSQSTHLSFSEIEAWGSIPRGPRLGFVPLLRGAGMGTDQSSTWDHPAINALDGNLATHSHTQLGTNQWWRTRVQDYYGQLVTVNKVTVWNRQDCCQERLEGAVLKLFGAGVNNLVATSAPLTSAEVQTIDLGDVNGVQYVQVHQDSKSTYLTIAEIEAWGSVPNESNSYAGLLKQGMYVDQSSTLDHPAVNALDGNYDTFVQTNIGTANYWRVRVQDYYGKLVTVNKVTVWNRQDCCQERLEGAVVLLFGAGSGNLVATSAPLTSAEVQTIDFGEVTGVQWVQIHQDSQNTYLSFSEIEAWGKVA